MSDMTVYSRIVTPGQVSVMADMIGARLDAVLPAFGLRRNGQATVEIHQLATLGDEALVIAFPVRRREHV